MNTHSLTLSLLFSVLGITLLAVHADDEIQFDPFSHSLVVADSQTRYPYPAADLVENAELPPAPFSFSNDWITDSKSGLTSTEVSASIPLLRFGRPPPLVKVGFAYTDIFAAADFTLPTDLYEYTIGLSWIRPINERWTLRTILGIGLATDNQNTSSDAWQFRGGAFAIYQQNEQLSWTLGALATGRDDLPVIPAIGAIWQPNFFTRVDFLFPKPKVNFLIHDDGQRQHWAYMGFAIQGTTWAYEEPAIGDDRLTYNDLRVVVGWESRLSANSTRMPFARGKTFSAEIGYVFSRELEFENETRIEDLKDGFVVGISTRF